MLYVFVINIYITKLKETLDERKNVCCYMYLVVKEKYLTDIQNELQDLHLNLILKGSFIL